MTTPVFITNTPPLKPEIKAGIKANQIFAQKMIKQPLYMVYTQIVPTGDFQILSVLDVPTFAKNLLIKTIAVNWDSPLETIELSITNKSYGMGDSTFKPIRASLIQSQTADTVSGTAQAYFSSEYELDILVNQNDQVWFNFSNLQGVTNRINFLLNCKAYV